MKQGRRGFAIVKLPFFFLGCSKHKSLGIKPHIAHSVYKDSWVQEKHRQNSNKEAEQRQKSNNKTL